MRQVIETNKYTGQRVLWTIKPCTSCKGTGRRWHAGCGDSDMTCGKCYGAGETSTERVLHD